MDLDLACGRIVQAILDGEADDGRAICAEALEAGLPARGLLDRGFVPGMRRIGDLYADGDAFLPELVQAAEVMKAGMDLLRPALAREGVGHRAVGRVVIGTVAGDIHDIGKSIVASMLSASGFEVRDLGTQVPADRFVDEVETFGADILGLSALITTTLPEQRVVIERLAARGLRSQCRVIVGGAPCTARWATEIGADAFAEDALAAVAACKTLRGAA
jgi:corrinoid protein of di/trimethylamine methyltransferase